MGPAMFTAGARNADSEVQWAAGEMACFKSLRSVFLAPPYGLPLLTGLG